MERKDCAGWATRFVNVLRGVCSIARGVVEPWGNRVSGGFGCANIRANEINIIVNVLRTLLTV